MNTQNNTLPDPQQVLKDMLAAGQLNSGIIKDGLCATPKDQAEFDATQKGQPPETE